VPWTVRLAQLKADLWQKLGDLDASRVNRRVAALCPPEDVRLMVPTEVQSFVAGSVPVQAGQRFKAAFAEVWAMHIRRMRTLELYSTLKSDFSPEPYTRTVSAGLGSRKVRLRTDTFPVGVYTGRMEGIRREARTCVLCGEGVETVRHFLCDCAALMRQREALRVSLFGTRPQRCSDDALIKKILTGPSSKEEDQAVVKYCEARRGLLPEKAADRDRGDPGGVDDPQQGPEAENPSPRSRISFFFRRTNNSVGMDTNLHVGTDVAGGPGPSTHTRHPVTLPRITRVGVDDRCYG